MEFLALAAGASDRVDRMHQYRDEGNLPRDPNLRVNYLSEPNDYGRVNRPSGVAARHNIQLPLGKALTVKHAYRIAGQLPDIVVDQRDDSPRERHRSDSMEKIAWAVVRRSKGETTMASASWNASELGAACFDLYWDMKGQIPYFRSVDPAGILEVQGIEDPHDFQRVYRVWDAPVASVVMEYEGQSFRGEPIKTSDIGAFHSAEGVDMVRIVQLTDREKVLRFAMVGQGGAVGLYEMHHGYGFVPYIVIPNLGPYEDVWGWADYEFVRGLAAYIGAGFSREADVLKAVAGGAYQESGTGMNSQQIAKIIRDGGVASVKRDSRIEPIQTPDMPSFAEAHGQRAMDLLKMLGFAPDASWGLPGSGSGTDRGLQLQPLLEYTAMKQLNWQAGLNRMFSMVYRIVEKNMTASKVSYRGATPGRGGKLKPFLLTIGKDVAPDMAVQDSPQAAGGLGDPTEMVELPKSPKELFDGDYDARFVWRNRIDPEDPQYVMSELNKFGQGIQSLETTLENLGVQAPEDEMRRIEKEAERFPWVNQGLVSLITSQIRGNAQGQGGGAPPDEAGALAGAMETMSGLGGGGQSGALNADAGAGALGSDAVGIPYGGA